MDGGRNSDDLIRPGNGQRRIAEAGAVGLGAHRVLGLEPRTVGVLVALRGRLADRLVERRIGEPRVRLLRGVGTGHVRRQARGPVVHVADEGVRGGGVRLACIAGDVRHRVMVAVIAVAVRPHVILREDPVWRKRLHQVRQRRGQAREGVRRSSIDGVDLRNLAQVKLLEALRLVRREPRAVEVAVGQAHEQQRDLRVARQRHQRDRMAGDPRVRLRPNVGNAGHLGIGRLGAQFSRGPVVGVLPGVAGRHEHGPDALAGLDVVQEIRALEEHRVILVGHDRHRRSRRAAHGRGCATGHKQADERSEAGCAKRKYQTSNPAVRHAS